MQYRMGGFGGIPPVVKNLLILNALFFLAKVMFEGTFGINITQLLGLHYPKSEFFNPYQFITHMFMHANFMHLFFNMFALWMFGRVLESVWGPKRFFIYYLITGLGAAGLHLLVNHFQMNALYEAAETYKDTPTPDDLLAFMQNHFAGYYEYMRTQGTFNRFFSQFQQNPDSQMLIKESYQYVDGLIQSKMNIPTVGASGAVYGVLLGFGMLFPNTPLMLLFPPIPIKAKYFVIAYGAIELYLGFTQPGSNVAHFAHLGGMVFGFFLIKYWNLNRNNFY